MIILEKNTNTLPKPFFLLLWLTIFLWVAINKELFYIFLSYYYSDPSSTVIEKIHPAIYLLIFILLLFFLRSELIKRVVFKKDGINSVFYFFLSTCFAVLTSIYFNGISGAGYLIETHSVAAILGILTYSCSAEDKKKIKNMVLNFILFNSIIALCEFLLNRHLIGYPQHATALSFRSAAFFGHPLNNALITASALFFIFSTKWRLPIKLIYSFFYTTSLLCYGARTASFIGIGALAAFIAVIFLKDFNKKTRFLEISIFIFFSIFFSFILYLLICKFGIGARIFEFNLFDQSGMVRIKLFNIFHYITKKELLTGIPQADVAILSKSLLGINTIENFWVIFILTLGLPIASIFCFLFINMFFSLTSHQQVSIKLGALTFLLVASSNNSLSSKSVSLTIIILLLVTSYQPLGKKPHLKKITIF